MKKGVVFFIFVWLITFFSLNVNAVVNNDELLLDLSVSGSFDVMSKSTGYTLKNVLVNMSFYPKGSFNQDLLSIETDPEAEDEDGYLIFEWNNPTEKKIDFGYESRVKTESEIKKVKKKIDFPIKDLSSEYDAYTKPSETIDSDDREIISLASQIVSGEDDLFIAAFKLADWTKKNIEYNLSTLTATASQKASWVLDNRKGVCDEMTSLFIALCRAVGIPARFVSGIAFTNSDLFDEEWGAHGWSEVYFPGYGWVPFDVTYGEFGYINPGHIKMRDAIDSAASSTKYEWLGKNVDLRTRNLDSDVKVISEKGNAEQLVQMQANALKNEVSFGSYNLIEVTVKNIKDFYVANEIYFSRTGSMEIIGNDRVNVILKPFEEKRLYWIVKIDSNLDEDYVYTFPLVFYSLRNVTASTNFRSSDNDRHYSLSEIGTMLDNFKEEEIKQYSREVTQECQLIGLPYLYDEVRMKCDVKNSGNIMLNDLEVCLKEDCQKINLGISEIRQLNYSLKFKSAGPKEIVLSTKNNVVSKYTYNNFEVLEEPKIKVKILEKPNEVRFEELYKVSFDLKRTSNSIPKDIKVMFSFNGNDKEILVDNLSEDKNYIVNLVGKDLYEGANDFKVFVTYFDDNFKEYSSETSFSVNLVDVTLMQKMEIWAYKLDRYLRQFDLTTLLIYVGVGGFVFSFILIFLFHRVSRKY